MKKTLMFVLMLAVCFLVMPVALADTEYPTVTDITNSDTLKSGKVSLSEIKDGTLTVTVANAEFKLLGEGEHSENRPDNKAWVGLHFVFPENTKDWKIGEPAYGSKEFDEYFGFDLDKLKEAAEAKTDYEKSWTLTWKETEGEVEHSLKIKLVVKPESVVLLDKTEENKEDWNEAEYLKESKQVKVIVSYINESDPSIGSGTAFYWTKSTKITEKEILTKLGVSSNHTIKGIYTDTTKKTAFDFSKPLEGNTTIYVYYVEKAKAKDEKNPATGDNLLTYVSLSVIALTGALGTGLYLKKVNE